MDSGSLYCFDPVKAAGIKTESGAGTGVMVNACFQECLPWRRVSSALEIRDVI